MTTLFEKAVKRVSDIKTAHAAKIAELRADLDRLQVSIDGAEHQRLEALQAGNQKMYSGAMFALDQAKTERANKETALAQLETDPIIDKATAESLEADLLAGLADLADRTDRKYIEVLDGIFPEIQKAYKQIEDGNALLTEIHFDLLKDEKSRRYYEQTGLRDINSKRYSAGISAANHLNNIRSGEYYRTHGGKYPIMPESPFCK